MTHRYSHIELNAAKGADIAAARRVLASLRWIGATHLLAKDRILAIFEQPIREDDYEETILPTLESISLLDSSSIVIAIHEPAAAHAASMSLHREIVATLSSWIQGPSKRLTSDGADEQAYRHRACRSISGSLEPVLDGLLRPAANRG